jgi:hypothetical protein
MYQKNSYLQNFAEKPFQNEHLEEREEKDLRKIAMTIEGGWNWLSIVSNSGFWC